MIEQFQITECCVADFSRQKVYKNGAEVTLSNKISGRAWKFLHMLVQADSRILTYDYLNDSDIWPDDRGMGVDHKNSLKNWASAFNKAFGEKCIKCDYNTGYSFVPVLSTTKNVCLQNNEPLRISANIIARKSEMKKIAQALEDRVIFISGMDGIGKTTLIKSFVTEERKKFNKVVYIQFQKSLISCFADDNKVLLTNFQRKITETAGVESDESYAKRKIAKLSEIVSEDDVFIIDDFNQDDEIFYELIGLKAKFIFVTNRHIDETNFPVVRLSGMTYEESIKLFFIHYLRQDINPSSEDIKKLFCLIKHHTLTIVLLAKQMMINRKTPSEILGLFENGVVYHMIEEIRLDPLTSPKPAYKYLCELFTMDNLKDYEEKVLDILCLTSPSSINVSELNEWINDNVLYQTIENLRYAGWIEHNLILDTVSIHPIIREVILYCRKPDITDYAKVFNNILSNCSNFDLFTLPLSKKKEYGELFYNILMHNTCISEVLIPFYFKAERMLSIAGFVDESLFLSVNLEEFYTTAFSSDRFKIGYLYYSRGWTYSTQQRDRAKGMSMYSKAIENIEQQSLYTSEQKIILYEIYSDIGLTICRTENEVPETANRLIGKALQLLDEVMQDESSSSLKKSWFSSFLAECYIKQNQLDDAKECIDYALSLHSQYSGKEDVYLCNIKYRESKLEKAKGNITEALAIAEYAFKIYSRYHPYTTKNNIEHFEYLGELSELSNDYDKSISYYSKAMEISKILYQDDSKMHFILKQRIESLSMKVEDNEKKHFNNICG